MKETPNASTVVSPHIIKHFNFPIARPNPRWSSVNNGVFLCAKCARLHQNFSKSVSLIKSLEADLWEKGEIQLIKFGGNNRFNSLMNEYNIPLTTNNQKYKYYTKIADYYRKVLKDESQKGSSLQFKPDKREGIKVIKDYNPEEKISSESNSNPFENNQINTSDLNKANNNNNTLLDSNYSDINMNLNNPIENNNNNPYLNNKSNSQQNMQNYQKYPQTENINQDFNLFMSSISQIFNKVGNNISNKMKEIGWDQKFQEATDATIKFVDNSKEFLKDKKKEVQESQIFKNIQTKAEETFEKISQKANEMLEQSNHPNQPTHQNQLNSNYSNININNPSYDINVNIDGIDELSSNSNTQDNFY